MESGITESLFDKCVQDWVEGKKCGGTYICAFLGGSQKSIIHTRTQMSEGLITYTTFVCIFRVYYVLFKGYF